jgi:hypothetical protein
MIDDSYSIPASTDHLQQEVAAKIALVYDTTCAKYAADAAMAVVGPVLRQLRAQAGKERGRYEEMRGEVSELRTDRDRARDLAAALEAENARVRELHPEFRIYGECGHKHAEGDEGVVNVNDVGLVCEDGFMYSVCRECCTDGHGNQTEECASAHDHPGWLCATNTILHAAEAGED